MAAAAQIMHRGVFFGLNSTSMGIIFHELLTILLY
jgi:hypothetical protein